VTVRLMSDEELTWLEVLRDLDQPGSFSDLQSVVEQGQAIVNESLPTMKRGLCPAHPWRQDSGPAPVLRDDHKSAA
jgi:hypothetical protein